MQGSKALYSHASDHWSTPPALYAKLDYEFGFKLDPCPLHGTGGLELDWGKGPAYVNAPYSGLKEWLQKSLDAVEKGCTVVFLAPARTDTKWFSLAFENATEVRFIKGRLRFGGGATTAPFPSVVFVFKPGVAGRFVTLMERA